MGTNALRVWQRTPDDGDAASGDRVRHVAESAADPDWRRAACGRSTDAYGCVDWFDYVPQRDVEMRRRDDERATGPSK